MARKKRDDRGEIFPAEKQRRENRRQVDAETMAAAVESFNDVRGEVEALQRRAADYVAESCEETTPEEFRHTHTAQTPDGIRTFIVPPGADESLIDAVNLTVDLAGVLRQAKAAGDSHEVWMAVRFAMNAGMRRAMLFTRDREHEAAVGRVQVGKPKTHLRPQQKSNVELHREAVAAVEQAARDFGDRGKTVQKRRAAESLGIRLSTLYDRLKKNR